ncbi:MAG TPA: hypothetical protein VGZ02_06755 [Candidatus Baltobacteraceae bacterium]|nr:hypothetical protein [Candidatus Baltobacteraceae bacterium]
MRLFFSVLLAGIVSTVCVAQGLADPVSDLAQMQASFGAVHSMHFDIVRRDGRRMSIDMIKPDRYRGMLAGGVQAVIIGSTTWTSNSGHWGVDPKAKGASGEYLQNARTPLNGEPARDFTVVYLGPSNVGGIPVQHYRATRRGSAVVDELWVGANHLPLKVMHEIPQGTTTILYSQYNNVAPINRPV